MKIKKKTYFFLGGGSGTGGGGGPIRGWGGMGEVVARFGVGG